MTAKPEMAQLHGLVGQARRLLTQARHGCNEQKSAYDQARAIAWANEAGGYANAADVLHFHYMKEPAGSGATKTMQ